MEKSIAKFRSSTSRWLVGSFAGLGTLVLCVVLVGLVIIAARWLRNVATSYELTDQRLIIHSGIFNKRTDEIELFRIKDVAISYSLINQWVDIGAISIRSSDPTTANGPLVLRDIPEARALREQMRMLVNAARQARGVREIDVDAEAGLIAGH
ncbi:MAG: PH domain-containing protein [Sphingomonas sp.]|nr:PH domain-containing protein [Sphingomonas sp.]